MFPEPIDPPKLPPVKPYPSCATAGLVESKAHDFSSRSDVQVTITATSVGVTGTGDLTESLTVVASGDLNVTGDLTVGTQSPGATPITILLVSLNNDVTVAAGATVGIGQAPPGEDDTGLVSFFGQAYGEAGANGGLISLLAPKGNVRILGSVIGIQGGDGGKASVRGRAAAAVGGGGGKGGDILLCARDSIGIGGNGEVRGSLGGAGGDAEAVGSDHSTSPPSHIHIKEAAYAQGGPAGNAGEIYFRCSSSPGKVQVFNNPGGHVRFPLPTANRMAGGNADAGHAETDGG